MAVDFTIKRNDRLPSLAATLTDALGAPVDLTSTLVRFIMAAGAGTGTVAVNAPAVVVNSSGGTVRYDWAAGDTATSGTFNGEFEVTFPNGKKQTFPSANYITIQIFNDLDNL